MSQEIDQIYEVPNENWWQGRIDSPTKERVHQYIHCLPVNEIERGHQGQALLGFCSDEGIIRNLGRPGAKNGPPSIRHELRNLCLHQQQSTIYDLGNIHCLECDLESSQIVLGQIINKAYQNKINPIVFGGGHETAFGHYLGLHQAFHNKDIGIINFDAHFDLRPLLDGYRSTSGTPFHQIANLCKEEKKKFDYTVIGIQETANSKSLFEKAKQTKTKYILASDIHQGKLEKAISSIKQTIENNDIIYLTICLDVLSQDIAPGVSAPNPTGLKLHHVTSLMQPLLATSKTVAFDIVELSPPYDQDHQTAKIAANLTTLILDKNL